MGDLFSEGPYISTIYIAVVVQVKLCQTYEESLE